jgi:Cu/Ag efflux pump CusA
VFRRDLGDSALMAVVTTRGGLGGLATATVLTLFVLPTLALRFCRFAERPNLDAEETRA